MGCCQTGRNTAQTVKKRSSSRYAAIEILSRCPAPSNIMEGLRAALYLCLTVRAYFCNYLLKYSKFNIVRHKPEVILKDTFERNSRNDRPKDKQPNHQAVSAVQRQMVQKFVKELNDSAKRSDRSDSAERTATEQVEMTAREIVYETVQLPRHAINSQPAKNHGVLLRVCSRAKSDQPHHAPESPRRTNRRAAYPVRCNAAAEHIDTRSAGNRPDVSITANRKNGHDGDHVDHAGTVTVPSAETAPRPPQYAPDRAIDRKPHTRRDPTKPQTDAIDHAAPGHNSRHHAVEKQPRQRTEDVRTNSALKRRQSAISTTGAGRACMCGEAKKSC